MRIFGDHYIGRLCVRIFRRPRSAPQRPYVHTGTCIAFGAGPVGVMVMRRWMREEIEAFNRAALEKLRASRPSDRSESDGA